ncbi:MAG: molybdopterin-guanine dinucleotide biosynthesis protein A [Alphaproteobacteria bacterium]
MFVAKQGNARGFAVGAWLAAMLLQPAAAQDRDRHSGYYYPPPTVSESYDAEATPLTGANRVRRIGFITIIVHKTLTASYAPPYTMFVKGTEGEKLIIVGMGDYVANVYQARGLLAQLTAQARTTEVFKEVDPDNRLTFLDLLKMLGFDQVTVSDGKSYTLQITIK